MGLFDKTNSVRAKDAIQEIKKMQRKGIIPRDASLYIRGELQALGITGGGVVRRDQFDRVLKETKINTQDPVNYGQAAKVEERLLTKRLPPQGLGLRKIK